MNDAATGFGSISRAIRRSTGVAADVVAESSVEEGATRSLWSSGIVSSLYSVLYSVLYVSSFDGAGLSDFVSSCMYCQVLYQVKHCSFSQAALFAGRGRL
jgi:hypothetical protein